MLYAVWLDSILQHKALHNGCVAQSRVLKSIGGSLPKQTINAKMYSNERISTAYPNLKLFWNNTTMKGLSFCINDVLEQISLWHSTAWTLWHLTQLPVPWRLSSALEVNRIIINPIVLAQWHRASFRNCRICLNFQSFESHCRYNDTNESAFHHVLLPNNLVLCDQGSACHWPS